MPYYCTVPQCTSMAGKCKDISFHQFPRDEVLAQKWNIILKRGKPYTKYSKVCSLHFTSADYTMTNMGKNKGQLRKDAVPSQNLPLQAPAYRREDNQTQSLEYNHLFSHQHLVTLMYLQASAAASISNALTGGEKLQDESVIGETDILEGKNNEDGFYDSDCLSDGHSSDGENDIKATLKRLNPDITITANSSLHTYKCTECLRCFKDPSVYELHQRTHKRCRKCGDEFQSGDDLNDHIRTLHGEIANG